jgi:hypothetical protein
VMSQAGSQTTGSKSAAHIDPESARDENVTQVSHGDCFGLMALKYQGIGTMLTGYFHVHTDQVNTVNYCSQQNLFGTDETTSCLYSTHNFGYS